MEQRREHDRATAAGRNGTRRQTRLIVDDRLVWLGGFLVFCQSILARPSVAAELTPATVNRAINRGVDYLRSQQNADGGWDEWTGQSCGLSALCTLSILNATGDPTDRSVTAAVRYLRGKTPAETYSVALQTLVFCELGSPTDLQRIRRNVRWLVDNQTASGSWSYFAVGGGGDRPGQNRSRGGGDPSNAQFAVLALGAAADRGIDVPADVFRRSAEYWSSNQHRGGGWSYGASRPTGSMTCAGIASLIICGSAESTSVGSASVVGDRVECCGGDDSQRQIEKGIDWLAANFTTAINPRSGSSSHLYYLYALERTGRLSGRRFIGNHDWYREGADRLLSMQDAFKGYWRGAGAAEPPPVATSFAVLFLSKGRRKVVLGRLKYAESPQRWRRHSGAMAGLVGRLESAWDQKLTWQTIDADRATVEDLLQAPVILITGAEAIDMPDAVAETMKQYVAQGGTVIFDADAGDGCGDASAFNRDVLSLTRRWTDGGTMQRLPPEHPVWTIDVPVDVDALPPDQWVYGVEACCRTSVFYVPASLSCRWALAGLANDASKRIAKPAADQINAAVHIGQNILAYATGRRLKEKLQTSVLVGRDDVPPIDRGTVRMATLATATDTAGPDRAAEYAAQFAATGTAVSIAALPDAVPFDAGVLADVQFLWVHGRGEITWDADQIAVLRTFLDTGGILIASSICGDRAFTESLTETMPRLVDDPLQPIDDNDPVLQVPGGYDLRSVTVRYPAGQGGGVVARDTGGPELLVARDARGLARVFFSPLDLSCALQSPNSIQCPGYDTTDAAKIVTNIVLLGLTQ